jgi:hypothetical protein
MCGQIILIWYMLALDWFISAATEAENAISAAKPAPSYVYDSTAVN